MSWLARSIARTLLPSDDEEEEEQDKPSATTSAATDTDGQPLSPTKGVKDDISELRQTLTRQFRGFASFLAPPPQFQPEAKADDDLDASDSSRKLPGIRSDFAEIGGRFRSGISKISEHVAVSEIAKIATSFLPLGSDEDDEDIGVVGVTEEVLMFVEDISMQPGTWVDFPLLEEECDDFEMSDVQQEHALAMEQLVPRLAALRIELCPNHMSERCFWKIYFMLVYPRLDVKDAELLFAPQIMDPRRQNQKNKEVQEYDSSTVEVPILEVPTLDVPQKSADNITTPIEQVAEEPPSKDIYDIPSSSSSSSSSSSVLSSALSSSKSKEEETLTRIPISDIIETEKHPVEVIEVKIMDKSVIKEEEPPTKAPVSVQKVENSEDSDGDDEWLQEDTTDNTAGVSQNIASVPLVDDEDVSFSDLEDEDDKK